MSRHNKLLYLGGNCYGMEIIIDLILNSVQAIVMQNTIHMKLAWKGANKFSKYVSGKLNPIVLTFNIKNNPEG